MVCQTVNASPSLGSIVRTHRENILGGTPVADGTVVLAIVPSFYAVVAEMRHLAVSIYIYAVSLFALDYESHRVVVVSVLDGIVYA